MHEQEIRDLESQAGTHQARTRELLSRAMELRYSDLLEKHGLTDSEVIEYRGERIKLIGIEGSAFLIGNLVRKDGEVSVRTRVIRDLDRIVRPK